MTRRGISLIFGGFLCWTVGRLFAVPELMTFGVIPIVLVAGTTVAMWLSPQVHVERRIENDQLQVGTTTQVTVHIRNQRFLPLPLVTVVDTVTAMFDPNAKSSKRFGAGFLRRGHPVIGRYNIVPSIRGTHRFGPLIVTVQDPLGLARRTRRLPPVETRVVHPRVTPITVDRVIGARHGRGNAGQRHVQVFGDEFYTLREYVQGDDFRLVHWSSTAHHGGLMVRQMEYEVQPRVTVVLNTRRELHTTGTTGTLERCIEVSASLIATLLKSGYTVRFVTNTTGFSLRPAPTSLPNALDTLSKLRRTKRSLSSVEVNHMGNGDGLLIIVTGSSAAVAPMREEAEAIQNIQGFSTRHAVVVTDPTLVERNTTSSPPASSVSKRSSTSPHDAFVETLSTAVFSLDVVQTDDVFNRLGLTSVSPRHAGVSPVRGSQ